MPILSTFTIMLKRKATISIKSGPLSFAIAINGFSGFVLVIVSRLRIYAPQVTKIAPPIPTIEGYSPIMRGDVSSRKTGVNANIGTVNDNGEYWIAFINRKIIRTPNEPLITRTSQNSSPSAGISIKNNSGTVNGSAKKAIEKDVM